MKVAVLTTDDREHYRDYENPRPRFGAAPEALLQGMAALPDAEVHVVSCTRRPLPSSPKLAENIWYHNLQVPQIGWIRTLYQGCIRAVRRKLREIQPDVVHGQGTEKECAVAAVFSGFPNVVTIHGNMVDVGRVLHARFGSYHWLAARLETLALRRTGGVFCNSAHTERVVAPRARRTWRVPNALRAAFVSPPGNPATRGGCVLLNVGSVCNYKRQLELIETLGRLHHDGARFEIRFLGQANRGNPYTDRFMSLIEEAKAKSFGQFLGTHPLEQLISEYEAATALVHVSAVESFGLVVAEALARNLKFFGFGVGGVTDIGANVEGAELFADGDWNGLREAIGRWIAAGFPRPTTAAGTMRERYHPEVIARRHLAIYREVLSRVS